MAFSKIFFFLLALGFWFLVSQCAQIVNPNGGPKDVKPPYAVKYTPDSAQTNFTEKNIAIVFDEYIQLNDLQKQLVISPPMAVAPEVKVKGKSLLIVLNDSLKKNTTYAFNFGDAVRDFTENNAIDNFQYIFSTGSFIDSLSLSGIVKNAFDMKPDKGILVMLYDTHDDSVPYKKTPSYFARTKTDGSYKINNIRQGTYKAFALKDANNNYLYDVPTEQIAFSDTLINIKKNTSLNLSLFKEEPKKQKLLKASIIEHGHIIFSFAKPVDSLKLNFFSPEPKRNVIYEYSKEKDTLHYWFSDEWKDTLKIQIAVGNKILDTVHLKPITVEQMSKSSRGGKWRLGAIANVKKDRLFDYNQEIELRFNHPISNAQTNSFDLKQGNNKINFTNTEFSDTTKRKFIFKFPLVQDSIYHLFIPPATFTDIFGLTNDTIKVDFKTQEEKYYGTLKLSLKMKIRIAYMLQLMNEKGEIFDYASSEKGVFSYQYLPPGPYKLRIIYDKNGDEKWTSGDYLSKKKPETIIYYPSPITIRSNWDLELDWTP